MHLPVTALATTLVNRERIVLVGQGPCIKLYESNSSKLLNTTRIFESQAVHQICVCSGVHDRRIVVAGGRHVAKVSLTRTAVDDQTPRLDIFQRSVLPAEEWTLAVGSYREGFVLLTTNNNLYLVDQDGDAGRGVRLLVNGPGSFLYSGAIQSIDSRRILVAAGSVFGEVLAWECRQISADDDEDAIWTAETKHRFEGHTGSIFGVSSSDVVSWHGRQTRLVASCSDDRTVQVWDVGADDHVQGGNGVAQNLDTGFGRSTEHVQNQVASGWGHQSRIWGVEFLPVSEPAGNLEELRLVTRGEDGTCQLWSADVSLQGHNDSALGSLKSIYSDRHHSGKNVWSWTMFTGDDRHFVVSGGADGRVVLRRLPGDTHGFAGSRTDSVAFQELPLNIKHQNLKEYTIMDDGKVVALSNDGSLLRCNRDQGRNISWEIVWEGATTPAIKLCANLPDGMLAFGSKRRVHMLLGDSGQVEVNLAPHMKQPIAWMSAAGHLYLTPGDHRLFSIVVASLSGETCIIWYRQGPSTTTTSVQRIQLPEHFIVTSTCHDYNSRLLLLGSRAGAVAIYLDVGLEKILEPISCLRHVHGSDAVTSLQFLHVNQSQRSVWVLSTGRDGTYAIHEIINHTEPDHMSLRTVHRSSPPFGPYIEGAFINQEKSGPQLILYGFRSKNFVVWNETNHTDVLSVDCGGAHRSWAFRNHGPGVGSTFVWTKAGTFNMHTCEDAEHIVLQYGGHGREIKAMAVCPEPYSDIGRGFEKATLVATGAEDTTVRLFAVVKDAASTARIVQLCVLNEHSAGLQDLAFSACGTYLFSCGGAEQLYAWRVTTDVPVIGVGVTLLAKIPRNEDDADVRIMSISVAEPSSSSEQGLPVDFRVAAAYSNGKVKVLRFRDIGDGAGSQWSLEREVKFGSFCLMQVVLLSSPEPTQRVFSAGSNGFLNLTTISDYVAEHDVVSVHQIHQSAILALDVLKLSPNLILVATGGDDNALGLTLVSRDDEHDSTRRHFATVRINDAHAAALTSLAMQLLDSNSEGYMIRVVSAGDDQRVHTWHVAVPEVITDAQQFHVVRRMSQWTNVADVSAIESIGSQLLVAGVGLQVLDRLEELPAR